MELLLTLTLRSSMILVAAGLLTVVVRHASPALRQWLWTVAFVSVLALPLLMLFTPSIAIRVPVQTNASPGTVPVLSPGRLAPVDVVPAQSRPPQTTNTNRMSSQTDKPPTPVNSQSASLATAERSSVFHLSTLFAILWATGALVASIVYLKRVILVREIIKQSHPYDQCRAFIEHTISQLGITRQVKVFFSDRINAPMSTGIRCPLIVLPESAVGWSEDRLQMILQHELVHIARHDMLAQWIEVCACIVYWYNPLVWLSVRFSAIEREIACDDRVLSLGNKNTDYAAHLIEIAHSVRGRKLSHTLAFSFRSSLSRRVRHILNTSSDHHSSSQVNRYAVSAVMLLIVALLGTATVRSVPVIAQDAPVVLSVRLPEYMQREAVDSALRTFEENNPGVRIALSEETSTEQLFPAYNGADAFEIARSYFSSADVLMLGPSTLNPLYTRAGFLLDLSPLVDADSAFDLSEYHDAAWQSVRWDGGMWAIPVAFDLVLFMYDPAAFDAAGLSYPDETWTIEEIENAGHALTQRADGDVAATGLFTFNTYTGMLLNALSGQPTADAMLNPQLSNYTAILDRWSALQDAGIVGVPSSGNLEDVPFSVESTVSRDEDRHIALLPGGMAGVQTSGFGVSSGTSHPELAYELAKFLSTRSDIASQLFSLLPARTDIQPATTFPETWQDTIDAALANPLLEPPYLDYLDLAISGQATLDQAQSRAEQALATAMELHNTATLSVENPPPVIAEPDETIIRFAAVTYVDPFPNRGTWQSIANDFAANDPEVAAVEILTPDNSTLSGLWQDYDCIYSTYRMLPPREEHEGLLINLDPLLDTDPSVNPDDFVGGTFQRVQIDNTTWAYPLIIEPYVMKYDPEVFDAAGLSSPADGWTPSEFEGAVRQLSQIRDGDFSFGFAGNNSTSILMLIAAYGGLPIDFRANPPVFDLSDPDTVAAIQRVLDLFKEGYANYQELGIFNMYFPRSALPIYTDSIGIFSVPARATGQVKVAPYPAGTYIPITYEMGAAYITANAPNPEACYRWISSLAENAYLLDGIPARLSVINSPELVAAKGPDDAAFYQFYGTLMSQPNAVIFPPFSGNVWYEYQSFLNEAFDLYLLEGADLETALQDAQRKVDELMACDARAEEQFTFGSEDYRHYRNNCLMEIDERWREILSPSPDE